MQIACSLHNLRTDFRYLQALPTQREGKRSDKNNVSVHDFLSESVL